MTRKITLRQAVAAGYCIDKGIKPWFKSHGLDFKDFARNGIDFDVIRSIEDAMAQHVCDFVEKERRDGK